MNRVGGALAVSALECAGAGEVWGACCTRAVRRGLSWGWSVAGPGKIKAISHSFTLVDFWSPRFLNRGGLRLHHVPVGNGFIARAFWLRSFSVARFVVLGQITSITAFDCPCRQCVLRLVVTRKFCRSLRLIISPLKTQTLTPIIPNVVKASDVA